MAVKRGSRMNEVGNCGSNMDNNFSKKQPSAGKSANSARIYTVANAPVSYDPTIVEAFLVQLDHISVNGVTEIRCLFDSPQRIGNKWTGKTVVGYYEPSHYANAANDIAALDGRANIYVTLNPVKPDLLARAKNRLQFDAKHSATDADIIRRLWFPGDVDPVRPSGISSTDEELRSAIKVRDNIAAEFRDYGFSVITGVSGNGAHFMVRIDEVPQTQAVSEILADLSRHYGTPQVNVDTSVSNASRIWKCYGTLACKGDSTPERPHRRAIFDLADTKPQPQPLENFPVFIEDMVAPTFYNPCNAPKTLGAWVNGAINRTCLKLESAPDGQKHTMLLRAASNLGGFIHTGAVTVVDIENALMGALNGRAKDVRAARETILAGVKWGEAHPLPIPHIVARRSSAMPPQRNYLTSGENEVLSPTPNYRQRRNIDATDVYSDAIEESEKGGETPQRWHFTSPSSLRTRPRPLWLIRDILILATAAVLSGDSQSFKTFCALAMAFCVATGLPWHGREVRRGAVVYIAAEGGWTLRDQLEALETAYGVSVSDDMFFILEIPVAFGDLATIKQFADFIKNCNPALVIIDTLSACAEGLKENASEDMATFVRHMKAVATITGATNVVIHHNNKGGDLRGAVSLKNDVDTHLTFARSSHEDDLITVISCSKQRGGKFPEFALQGKKIQLRETDEYGRPVTSLVFEQCDTPGAETAKPHANIKRANEKRARLLEIFDEIAREYGSVKVGTWNARSAEVCSDRTFWRHRDAIEESGAIEEFGTQNGSKIYRRSNPTATTVINANDINDTMEHNTVTTATLPLGSGSCDSGGTGKIDNKGRRGKNNAYAEPYTVSTVAKFEVRGVDI